MDHTSCCNMRGDLISMLVDADCVIMLPGWKLSVGCNLELTVAIACGLPIYFYDVESKTYKEKDPYG